MKSFNKTMSFLAGLFAIMIILSIAVASSYINRNNLSGSDLWGNSSHIQFSDDWEFNGLFSSNHRSNEFETLVLTQTDTFDLKSELFISSSIEEITFIEEDRNDIMIEFYREYPDTSTYNVKYEVTETIDRINISSTLSIRGLIINKDYSGNIKVHIPTDYHFNKVTLDSSATVMNTDNIYTKTDVLTILADFGDIDINIDQPIETVSINCDMGAIKIYTSKAIGNLDISNDIGDLFFNIDAPVNNANFSSNLGQISGEFKDEVGQVNASTDLGNIDITFHKNENMVVTIDVDLGDKSSDFPTTNNSKDFRFSSDLGSVQIHKY